MTDPVPEKPGAIDHEQLLATIIGLVPYEPSPNEWAGIRHYLTSIDAAVRLLPVCVPIADGLSAGFDPMWGDDHE
ncbi:MAG: hypothetical protein M3464_15505 [Chloroflexota bacterium]|nr:hypothetical protein [Chloroflexota bacterium]